MQDTDVRESLSVIEGDVRHILEQQGFRGEVRFDEPLAAHTSLRIGGPVDIMVIPDDPPSLKMVLQAAARKEIPLFILGGGTNILVTDKNVEGIAVIMKRFSAVEITRQSDREQTIIFAGAGVPLPRLVAYAGKRGFSGLEALIGIPGQVGGAVRMNAGSFGREMKDVIVTVATMTDDGDMIILKGDDISFSYRQSGIPERHIILGAHVALERDDQEAVAKRMRQYLDEKRLSQPLKEHSAGCVFKNPQGQPAGRLIEEAGCKGMMKGDIEVSTVHANYFINRGQGTCEDFLQLMNRVRERVFDRTGISLDPEIRIIGGQA